jgi:hypothetical protein
MKEILKDMWGGLVNVTTYKHVIVIAMFLLFLYFAAAKATESDRKVPESDPRLEKIKVWMDNPKTNVEVPSVLKEALKEANYIGDASSLNEKGYYDIKDKKSTEPLREEGYYKFSDAEFLAKLEKEGYYKFNDAKIVEALSAHVKSLNDDEKEEYYSKGLIYELRDLASKEEFPFASLNNYLKATLPNKNDQPHTFMVNVSTLSSYNHKVIKLTHPKTKRELILLGNAALDGNNDQIHLNEKQLGYLIGRNKEDKADLKFEIIQDETKTKLKDNSCFKESKFITRTNLLCDDNVPKEMTKKELEEIIKATPSK